MSTFAKKFGIALAADPDMPVSLKGEGRLRYSGTRLEYSLETGPWTPFSGQALPVTDVPPHLVIAGRHLRLSNSYHLCVDYANGMECAVIQTYSDNRVYVGPHHSPGGTEDYTGIDLMLRAGAGTAWSTNPSAYYYPKGTAVLSGQFGHFTCAREIRSVYDEAGAMGPNFIGMGGQGAIELSPSKYTEENPPRYKQGFVASPAATKDDNWHEYYLPRNQSPLTPLPTLKVEPGDMASFGVGRVTDYGVRVLGDANIIADPGAATDGVTFYAKPGGRVRWYDRTNDSFGGPQWREWPRWPGHILGWQVQEAGSLPSTFLFWNIGYTPGVPVTDAGYDKTVANVMTVWDTQGQLGGTTDKCIYVYRPLPQAGTVIARLVTATGGGTGSSCGLMVRDSLNADARVLAVNANPGISQLSYSFRAGIGAAMTGSSAGGGAPVFLRLQVRTDSVEAAYGPTLSGPWTVWVDIPVVFSPCYIGFYSAGAGARLDAVFDSVQWPAEAGGAAANVWMPMRERMLLTGQGHSGLSDDASPTVNATVLRIPRGANLMFGDSSGRYFARGFVTFRTTNVTMTDDQVNNNLIVDIATGAVGGTGLQSLNGQTGQTQTFSVGTSGTDYNIVSAADIHTFNLPSASASARGAVTTADQTFAGYKTFQSGLNALYLDSPGVTSYPAAAPAGVGRLVYHTTIGWSASFSGGSYQPLLQWVDDGSTYTPGGGGRAVTISMPTSTPGLVALKVNAPSNATNNPFEVWKGSTRFLAITTTGYVIGGGFIVNNSSGDGPVFRVRHTTAATYDLMQWRDTGDAVRVGVDYLANFYAQTDGGASLGLANKRFDAHLLNCHAFNLYAGQLVELAYGAGLNFKYSNGNSLAIGSQTSLATSQIWYLPGSMPTAGQVLTASSVTTGGVNTVQLGWSSAATGGVGPGTLNRLAMFTSATTLGDSHLARLYDSVTDTYRYIWNTAAGMEWWRDTTPSRGFNVSWQQPGVVKDNDVHVSYYNGSTWGELMKFTQGQVLFSSTVRQPLAYYSTNGQVLPDYSHQVFVSAATGTTIDMYLPAALPRGGSQLWIVAVDWAGLGTVRINPQGTDTMNSGVQSFVCSGANGSKPRALFCTDGGSTWYLLHRGNT